MTLSIKVLGSGCAKCNLLERHVMEALEALAEERPALEATVLHVRDYEEIARYPVMFTPALVVNEEVVSAGHVPPVSKIKAWIQEALDHGGAPSRW